MRLTVATFNLNNLFSLATDLAGDGYDHVVLIEGTESSPQSGLHQSSPTPDR